MHENAVDGVLANARSTSDWLLNALNRISALDSEADVWYRPPHEDWAQFAKLRDQAVRVRRDMARRLAETRGAERRAAVICLAHSMRENGRFSGYETELDLALSSLE